MMRPQKPTPGKDEMRIMHSKLGFDIPFETMLRCRTQRSVLKALARKHMTKMQKAQRHDIKKMQANDN